MSPGTQAYERPRGQTTAREEPNSNTIMKEKMASPSASCDEISYRKRSLHTLPCRESIRQRNCQSGELGIGAHINACVTKFSTAGGPSVVAQNHPPATMRACSAAGNKMVGRTTRLGSAQYPRKLPPQATKLRQRKLPCHAERAIGSGSSGKVIGLRVHT